MIGIIGAMDDEINNIIAKAHDTTSCKVAGIRFICGFLSDEVSVCIAKCSPGKVNAALCAQIMINTFNIELIINVGVGCSLNKDVMIRDVVIATDVCQYDIDITALGEPRGFINGLNTIKIETDKTVSEQLAQCAISCGYRIHRGTIASGDTFIADSKLKQSIADEFDAVCGEMEGGAIGQVCFANGVKFCVIRTVSDGGDESSQLDYPQFKKIAAEISTTIIVQFAQTQKLQQNFYV